MVLAARIEAFPVLDLELALKRLPLEERTRAAWAQAHVDRALLRLRDEELTDALLVEVAEAVAPTVHQISRALVMALERREVQALFMSDFRMVEDRFRGHLDPAALDVLQYVLGYLTSFLDLVFTVSTDVNFREMPPTLEPVSLRAGPIALLYQAQVAVMGAEDNAKAGGDRNRTTALLDEAFLRCSAMAREFRAFGVYLSPFPHDTPEERRARALAAAEALRAEFTPEEWRALDDARLTNIR